MVKQFRAEKEPVKLVLHSMKNAKGNEGASRQKSPGRQLRVKRSNQLALKIYNGKNREKEGKAEEPVPENIKSLFIERFRNKLVKFFFNNWLEKGKFFDFKEYNRFKQERDRRRFWYNSQHF